MEREVQKDKKLDDGLHHGIIIDTMARETVQKYKYIDVMIELPDKFVIKASYADYLGVTSKLGGLMTRFGMNLQAGAKVDINSVLVGKDCQFQTITEGRFANVVIESLKPLIVEEKVQ